MLITDLGIVTDVKPVQLNALLPMLVTELPMINDVRLLHKWNAHPPMLVTELGMVTDVRL